MDPSRLDYLVAKLKETTFYYDPASRRFHGSNVGGLAEHSQNVARNLRYLTEKLELEWVHPDSPEIIGMAHDVCKVGLYLPDGEGGFIRNPNHPPGHGVLSVVRVSKWIPLSTEEIECIRWHMGPYTPELTASPNLKDDIQKCWTDFQKAIQEKRYGRNIYFTHVADMMATNFDEVPDEEGTA